MIWIIIRRQTRMLYFRIVKPIVLIFLLYQECIIITIWY